MAASDARKRTRVWFLLHGWCGLPVWLFLLFVCLTGTIATVDHEIMWLCDPSVRAHNPDHLPKRPLNEVVRDIVRQVPGAHVAEITFGEPYMALEVNISTPAAPTATAWVNPFTGVVQRVSYGITFPNFIRALHGWLLMPWFSGTPISWYAVTLLALPLLGSLTTGLVVYKRFWRSFLRPRLRLRSGLRVFSGDLHRLAAVWSIWFILVISCTGLWFLVTGVLFDLHMPLSFEDPDIPRREAPKLAAEQPRPEIDLDRALADVSAARPGITPLEIRLPEHALDTLSVISRSRFPLLVEEAWVHPYGGEVLMVRDWEVAGLREVISVVNGSLHFGNFGGLWVKLIWTASGVLLSTLVASGTIIWTKRTAQAWREAGVAEKTGLPVDRAPG